MAKRETNGERAEREDAQRCKILFASQIAALIKHGNDRHGFFPSLTEQHAFIGATCCHPHPKVSSGEFLRLVADMLDGKEPYNRGENVHFDKVLVKAYREASKRCRPKLDRARKDLEKHL